MKISAMWKAIVGGLAAGLAATATAAQDGTITVPELLTIAVAILGSSGLTWLVPNRTPVPDAQK